MMSTEQIKIVTEVYNRFISQETREWNELDNYLDLLEYLDDEQLEKEARIILLKHQNNKAVCVLDHPDSECFVPVIIAAVEAILELYSKSNIGMHKNNKYILQYYLALTQAEFIKVND